MDEDDEALCDQIKSDYCGEGRSDVHDTMRNFCRYVGFGDVMLDGAAEAARARQAVSREVAEMYDTVVDDIEEELEEDDDSGGTPARTPAVPARIPTRASAARVPRTSPSTRTRAPR